jgi:hypothetical protein
MMHALVGSERTNLYLTIDKHRKTQKGDLIFANLITYTLRLPNKMRRKLILLRYRKWSAKAPKTTPIWLPWASIPQGSANATVAVERRDTTRGAWRSLVMEQDKQDVDVKKSC